MVRATLPAIDLPAECNGPIGIGLAVIGSHQSQPIWLYWKPIRYWRLAEFINMKACNIITDMPHASSMKSKACSSCAMLLGATGQMIRSDWNELSLIAARATTRRS